MFALRKCLLPARYWVGNMRLPESGVRRNREYMEYVGILQTGSQALRPQVEAMFVKFPALMMSPLARHLDDLGGSVP